MSLTRHGVARIREMGIAGLLSSARLEDLLPACPDEVLTLRAYFPPHLSPSAKVRAFWTLSLRMVEHDAPRQSLVPAIG